LILTVQMSQRYQKLQIFINHPLDHPRDY